MAIRRAIWVGCAVAAIVAGVGNLIWREARSQPQYTIMDASYLDDEATDEQCHQLDGKRIGLTGGSFDEASHFNGIAYEIGTSPSSHGFLPFNRKLWVTPAFGTPPFSTIYPREIGGTLQVIEDPSTQLITLNLTADPLGTPLRSPWPGRLIILVLLLPVYGLTMVVLRRLYQIWQRESHRHQLPGYCPACGYDLRASPERCPECGWARTVASGCATGIRSSFSGCPAGTHFDAPKASLRDSR